MDALSQQLPFDPSALRGLSEKLVRSHHQNNYRGAVKRLNAIRTQWAALDFGSAPGFQINGLKREELIATNSMLLHELYFGSLAVTARPWCRRWPWRWRPTSEALSDGVRSSSRWARRWAAARAG